MYDDLDNTLPFEDDVFDDAERYEPGPLPDANYYDTDEFLSD